MLVIRQLQGKWNLKADNLRSVFRQCRDTLKLFSKVSLHHIPRAENALADRLSNVAMDGRKGKICVCVLLLLLLFPVVQRRAPFVPFPRRRVGQVSDHAPRSKLA
jgi:hypothetical protein